MSKKEQKNAGKILLEREMRPYRGVILFLTFLSIGTTLFSLAFAYLVRYLINSASSGNTKMLLTFALVLLGVLFGKILLKVFENYYAEKTRAKMYTQLRSRTFSKILRSDYACLQQYHSGDLLNRLTGDVQEICADTVGLAPTLAGMIVQCIGAVAALATIDPIFTAIYVVCGGIFGGVTALFRKGIKKRHKEVLESDGKVRAFVQEGLSSVMTVKAYGAEEQTAEKEKNLSTIYYQKRMKRNVFRSQMSIIFSFLSNFGLIFAVVWCSISILKGNSDYGSILSVILLLMQLQQPLTSFSSVLPAFYTRLASAERLAEIDQIPLEEESKKNVELQTIYQNMDSICMENVFFGYGKNPVFTQANTKIEKGKIVCLTGASGSGKSTAFKLLLNVFQASEGAISLYGNFGDSTNLILTAKERGLFAYVPQGNFFFSGTIEENLRFFLEEGSTVSEEKIAMALHVACADFVYSLPDGLQTKLCEGGEGLSEGQLQRLNVARAILSERPILLLDEATSALDGETEKNLLENIRSLQDKTCLIVTHRPAALEIADHILSVENGQIIVK